MKQVFRKMKQNITEFTDILAFASKISWKSSRFYTIVRLVTRLISMLMPLLLIRISGILADLLVQNAESAFHDIIIVFTVYFSLNVIMLISTKLEEHTTTIHNESILCYIEEILMDAAANADLSLFDSPDFYNDLQMAKENTYVAVGMIWEFFLAISSVISLISIFTMLIPLNSILIFFLVVVLIPITWLNDYYSKKIYSWSLENAGTRRQLEYLSDLQYSKKTAQEVRLYNIGKTLQKKYRALWALMMDYRKRISRKRTINMIAISILPEILSVFTLFTLVSRVIAGQNTVGDYVYYGALLPQFINTISVLVMVLTSISDEKQRAESFLKISQYKNTIEDTGLKVLDEIESIEFLGVSFRYNEKEPFVLNNVSFKIEKQTQLCLVGINGAGKTTLLKLLLRFYDPTEGVILINDLNIKEYTLHSLKKRFTCFFQEAENFAFSIRENLELADIDIKPSDSKLESALRNGDIYETVCKLPKKIDTYITKIFEEDGIEFSGGQHSKIALARAFYREGDVVLLDEPAASLDPEAEYKVLKNMQALSKNKIAIFTSHRLANVHFADRILVLENGFLIEEGTHEELINLKGRYSILYNYQTQKFSK